MTDRHRRAGMLLWWLPPLAVLLLLGSGLRAGVQGDCLDGSTRVPVGHPVQLTVDGPTWFGFGTKMPTPTGPT